MNRALVWMLLSLVALSTLYPIAFVILTTLRTKVEYGTGPLTLPGSITLDNLTYVWESGNVARYFWNSVLVVVPAAIMIASIACIAGYALVHLRFPLQRLAIAAVVAMLVLPPTVLMMPTFKRVIDLGLLSNHVGLILVYMGLYLPFNIYLFQSYMKAIPREMLDAAAVDGADEFRRFRSIAIPLVAPAIRALVTLNFVGLWNELLFALIVMQSEAKRTLVVGLATTRGLYLDNVPILAAGLLITLLPPMVVFVMFQRDLAIGLTSGASR